MPGAILNPFRTHSLSLADKQCADRMRKPISRPLVVSADGAYAFATLVCLTSAFLNSPELDFVTYWITSNRSHGAHSSVVRTAIERISEIFSRRIVIVPIDDSRFDSFTPPAQLPYLGNVTYNWLLAPSILDCNSFLLLDSDIVVQDSLDYLLSLDIGDNIIASVPNQTEAREKANQRLGLPADNVYFNTGVMIVNAERWRHERIFDTLMAWYENYSHGLPLADQDMVNVVLSNRKVVLDCKWNTQLHALDEDNIQKFDPEAFSGIFHFSGPAKPWQSEFPINVKALYEKYARVTPRL